MIDPLDFDDIVGATRLVARASAPRYTLLFSTGERHLVTGTALIGRRPTPQPGEDFDALITLHDPERSISKTHLELGVDEAGALWILDRYSANGTARIQQRAAEPLTPGRRYIVDQECRIQIGDASFDIT